MTSDPSRPFTMTELIELATGNGLHATRSQIRRWEEHGLIAEPDWHGRGRGRGRTEGTWSAKQVSLFLIVLGWHERRRITQVRTLCNLPVMFWLAVDPDAAPIGQIRRAMGTWARSVTSASETQVDAYAARAASSVAIHSRGRLTKLEVALVELTDEEVDPYQLLEAARAAIGADEVGPPRATLTPSRFATLLEARVKMVRRLAGEEAAAIPDELFWTGRDSFRESRIRHEQDWAEWARDPEIGHLFKAVPGPETDSVRACVELATHMALLSLAEDNGA